MRPIPRWLRERVLAMLKRFEGVRDDPYTTTRAKVKVHGVPGKMPTTTRPPFSTAALFLGLDVPLEKQTHVKGGGRLIEKIEDPFSVIRQAEQRARELAKRYDPHKPTGALELFRAVPFARYVVGRAMVEEAQRRGMPVPAELLRKYGPPRLPGVQPELSPEERAALKKMKQAARANPNSEEARLLKQFGISF